jgi:hypothetical protein
MAALVAAGTAIFGVSERWRDATTVAIRAASRPTPWIMLDENA